MALRISYLALAVTCSLLVIGCDTQSTPEVPSTAEILDVPQGEKEAVEKIHPRVAAEVNGHPVYETDVDAHIVEIQSQRFANGIDWTDQDLELSRRRVLEALIDQVLLAQELETPYSLQDSHATESAIMNKLKAEITVADEELALAFERVTRRPALQVELKIATLTAAGLIRQMPPKASHSQMGWVPLSSLDPTLRRELSERDHSVRAVRDRMQWFWVEERRTRPNELFLERQKELSEIVLAQKARTERQNLLRRLHLEARIQREPAAKGLR